MNRTIKTRALCYGIVFFTVFPSNNLDYYLNYVYSQITYSYTSAMKKTFLV